MNIKIGEFEVKSGKLVISDPCYDRDTWCAGVLENVRNGTWSASIVKRNTENGWGERVWELTALVNGINPDTVWTKTDIDVGVDSGQAGIFDDPEYQKPLTEPYLQVGMKEYGDNQIRSMREERRKIFAGIGDLLPNAKKELEKQNDDEFFNRPPEPTMDWYEMCCDKTLSNQRAGVVSGGAVSSSGYGDGGYNCFILKNEDNQIVGVKIVFISDDEDDFDDDEDLEDEE